MELAPLAELYPSKNQRELFNPSKKDLETVLHLAPGHYALPEVSELQGRTR